jgi:peptidyl-prolyl cis-trans isomerase A (cyclophilin A)
MHRLVPFLVVACLGCTSKQPEPADANSKSDPAAAAPAKADAKAEGPPTEGDLLDPSKATATAPDTYKVKFETTKGAFVVEAHRDWAPRGADRFYNLVKLGFYDDVAFFRAIDGFMVQFGINGDPKVTQAWKSAKIEDDEVKQSNKKGYITFATSGKNSRTTQVFINYGNNVNLDPMGFAPFGEVIEGMEVVTSLHTGYGEGAPGGMGPSQGAIEQRGSEYLRTQFPKLDWVERATIVE